MCTFFFLEFVVLLYITRAYIYLNCSIYVKLHKFLYEYLETKYISPTQNLVPALIVSTSKTFNNYLSI